MEYLRAFLVGGLICAAGQFLIDLTKLTPARILTFFVVLGVFLGGIGVYGRLAEFGGAGATVPIIGFGYAISEGVRKAVAERGFIGALTGGLTAAAGGLTAAMTFGVITALLARPKIKS